VVFQSGAYGFTASPRDFLSHPQAEGGSRRIAGSVAIRCPKRREGRKT